MEEVGMIWLWDITSCFISLLNSTAICAIALQQEGMDEAVANEFKVEGRDVGR